MADEPKPICRRVRENLAAYLDGELKGGARELIRQHLVECQACREQLEKLKETWRLLDELEAPIVPRRIAEEVLSRAHQERGVGRAGRLARLTGARGVLAGAAASIAAAVFLFGVYISSRPLGDVPTPVERECILYLDVLRSVETLENMEMVRHVQQLGQEIGEPDETDASEDSGV